MQTQYPIIKDDKQLVYVVLYTLYYFNTYFLYEKKVYYKTVYYCVISGTALYTSGLQWLLIVLYI